MTKKDTEEELIESINQLGDEPIQAEYLELMNVLAGGLDAVLNESTKERKTGFILLVFPFNDHRGRCNYISTANREDVIILLKEQLARFQGMPTTEGHA